MSAFMLQLAANTRAQQRILEVRSSQLGGAQPVTRRATARNSSNVTRGILRRSVDAT